MLYTNSINFYKLQSKMNKLLFKQMVAVTFVHITLKSYRQSFCIKAKWSIRHIVCIVYLSHLLQRFNESMPQSKCTFYVTQIMYTLIVLGNCFSFFFVFIFIGSVCLFWSRILFYKLYIKHKVLGVKMYDRKLYSFAAEMLSKGFLCVC